MPPQQEEANNNDNNLQEPLLGCSEEEEQQQGNEEVHDDSIITNKDIVLSCCSCITGKTYRMNHNVFLNLVLAVLYGISGSLWNGTAYAAYLKILGGGENGPLGNIEAVSGLATLITALPVGYMADRYGRSKVIRAGGILLFVASILQIGVLQWVGTDEEPSPSLEENDAFPLGADRHASTALWLMGVIMAFWGVGDGVVNGPCSALYADSTPAGERSAYYNYLFAAYIGATAAGPLVSIFLFQTLGDEWELYDLRLVIYVGLSLEVVNSLLMMLFDDSKALDEDEDVCDEDSPSSSDQEEEAEPAECLQALGEPERENDATATPVSAENSDDGDEPTIDSAVLTPLQRRQRWIPYIVFAQGLIFAIGSGMTVKFFPLFFKDEIGMSPSQVQIIYVCVPFVMVIASTLGSKLAASGFGRAQTTLLFSCLGISLLYAMVFSKKYLDVHPFLLVPIYVLRTSLMNASYPLQESILMDFVPKDERARWKSLDSVASFGWCGSAAFGGWLADKYDYTYTFLFTAILQTIGTVVWCLLLPLVPRDEGSSNSHDETEEANSGDGDADETATRTVTEASSLSDGDAPLSLEGSLQEPLLPEAQE